MFTYFNPVSTTSSLVSLKYTALYPSLFNTLSNNGIWNSVISGKRIVCFFSSSLKNQTYSNWELCLADGSEAKNEELEKYYKDEKLTKKSYNKLINKLDSDYNKDYEKQYYKLEKYNISYNIIYIIVVFSYFVGFNVITNGATLGKKLLKLRIVCNSTKFLNIVCYIYLGDNSENILYF